MGITAALLHYQLLLEEALEDCSRANETPVLRKEVKKEPGNYGTA